MSGTNMRGLTTFITDIRHCKSKDQEVARVENELSKIRNKFTSNKGLSGYQRKKYIWKLLYIYILGYEVDFGNFEAANLINSPKFSEKYTGYIATGMIVHESDTEIYKTVANSIKFDLTGNNEINQSLAIAMIGSLAPQELTEQLDKEIMRIAFSDSRQYSLFIKKKAILCLLRMYRKYKDRFDTTQWVTPILNMFEQRFMSLGFISSACSLLLGVSALTSPEPYQDCVPKIVKILQKIIIAKECSQDYLYYHTPNPWLQVKLLKILQMYPLPNDQGVLKLLLDVLKRIIKRTEVTKSVNKNNADHGILFEAANLIIHYGNNLPEGLHNDIVKLLGIFISVREPNLKYLGLETMCKFSIGNEQQLEQHLGTILKSLRVNDISIKRRALDLLYLMCTPNIAQKVVEELLSYSEDWADLQIKEELVLKIAILAEKYADDLIWYIDVVVRLVNSSGDYVTDDIWYRIIQMITGFGKEANPELQKYAAQKLYSALNIPHVHETLIKIGAFVISEYSQFLVDSGKEPQKIFDVLNRHFSFCSEKVRCMILNGFAKLAQKHQELRDQIQMIFQVCSEHFDPDLQQRGIEYTTLLSQNEQIQQTVLAKQPPYSEEIQNNNPLIKRIYKLKLGNQKELKDPTLQIEAKKRAEETVEYISKQGLPQKRTEEEEHIQKLRQHAMTEACKNKIALQGVNILTPPQPISKDIANYVELKNLLAAPIGKIAMQFESQEGKMENVSFMVSNATNNGLDFNISPVKYDVHPQILMQALSVDPLQQLPIGILFYEIKGQERKKEFYLPIFTNKFNTLVDMPPNIFDKFYEEYTNSNNNNFYKLDDFIQNPAPAQVPLIEVMKKAGALFKNVLNLQTFAIPSMDNIQQINAVGQFVYKDTNKDQVINLPIMLQLECFEEMKSTLRLGLRCAGNPNTIKNLYQVICMYMSP